MKRGVRGAGGQGLGVASSDRRRYEMPTVSLSPTSSNENVAATALTAAMDVYGSPNLAEDRRRATCKFDFSNSPGTYRRTLQELEAMRQRSNGTTLSDCFSLSSSMSSEADLSPVLDVAPFMTHQLQGTQLKEICAQTKKLEKRNEELKEELIQFKTDIATRQDGTGSDKSKQRDEL
ncbi:unnamed protein product [Soboliphyme baturini]|uniref:PRKG1_interact domain-containing protein n=1 Tax=Soboliphyme baturini TaxID=241478 RepID=A0A183IKK7_9BILA|nr:unnamed protein product [Soboliphyme baturini]